MSDAPLTVTQALQTLGAEMTRAGTQGATRDVRLLLAHAMGVDHGRLTLLARDPLDPAVLDRARDLCRRRAAGTPVSHLRGYRDFYGRRFSVDGRVLDPRPETETLVALALEHPFATVLDLGTGSGAIIVSLLAERPTVTGTATDLSPDALAVAAANADQLDVARRLTCVQGNWLAGVGGLFDLIVSNPPYIALDEMPGLAPELAHEPRMALTDEADGLTAYRIIARDAPAHLAARGRLMVEIGPTQGPAVRDLFTQAGLEQVAIHPDLDGRDRVVSGQKP